MNYVKQIEDKIMPANELLRTVQQWQANGDKVVFTNGCFDILHRGHVTYLADAAAQGNHLIVAINDDHSVKRLKGNGRPVNSAHDRAFIVASLPFVSAVCIFESDTPRALISRLLPDVLVKGGDYTPEQIAGATEVIAHGGTIYISPLLKGFSTTRILKKAKD